MIRSALLLTFAIAAGCAEHGDDGHRTTLDELARLPAKGESGPASAAKPAHRQAPVGPAPLEALTRLSAGNARFATGHRTRSTDSADDAAERAALANGQHPRAAVLTCADSRVPPEIIFDQSLGDLFVVRNAGNLAEPVSEGSLEYCVEHLGVRLIVVLGHASCGAVRAVSEADGQLPGHLADIQRAMPGLHDFAVERARASRQPDEIIADAVERNAIAQSTGLLAGSESLRKAVEEGRLAVIPAVYDLSTGVVGFLPPAVPGSAAKP